MLLDDSPDMGKQQKLDDGSVINLLCFLRGIVCGSPNMFFCVSSDGQTCFRQMTWEDKRTCSVGSNCRTLLTTT